MASTIDQQFVEFVAKSVVSQPDKVEVKRTIDEKGVLLELTVDPDDLGRIIGKRGATAQSLRTLLRALGTKNDARYNLKIVDNGDPSNRQPSSKTPSASDGTPPEDDEPVSSSEESEETENQEQEKSADQELGEDVEKDESHSTQKTRKELADLDDLDI